MMKSQTCRLTTWVKTAAYIGLLTLFPGLAFAGNELFLTPASINFGNVTTTAVASQTLTLFNKPADLKTDTATITGTVDASSLAAPFSILSGGGGFSLGPGQSKAVVIAFSPSSASVSSDNLSISCSGCSNGTSFSVGLSGTGINPVINISVSPSPLNFDDVIGGKSALQTLTITNLSNSTDDLTGNVDSTSLSSPFTVVNGGGSFVLPPGRSKSVVVSFSPPPVTTSTTFSDTLEITHNASGGATNVTVNGTGVPARDISISPTLVDFGSVTVGQSSFQTLTVTNLTTSTAQLTGTISTTPSNSLFTVISGGGDFSLSPGQSRRVTLSFTPTTAGVSSSGTLSITHNANNLASPTIVTLEGAGLAPVINASVSPGSLSFDDVVSGRSATQILTLTNLSTSTGNLTGNVDATSLTSPFTVVNGGGSFVLSPGQSRSVVVSFSPPPVATTTVFSGTLVITHNGSGGGTNVSVSGTGIPSITIAVAPAPVDFGNVTSGQLPTQTLTITNLSPLGTLTGSVDTSSLSSPFSVFSGGGPFSLGPGKSLPVVLRFSSPSVTVPTTFSGTLVITHNANNPPGPTNVSITGTAVPPVINLEVSPNPVDFSDVLVGANSTQSITITNLSTSTATLEGSVDASSLSSPFSLLAGGGSFSLAPGQSKKISVSFSPSAPGPAIPQTLSLINLNATSKTNCTSPGPTTCGVTLQGTGKPNVDLSINPDPVVFGNVAVGQTSTQNITIANLGTSTGELIGSVDASLLPPSYAVVQGGGSFSLAPGKSRIVVVSFSPQAQGPVSGTLGISHNATNLTGPSNVAVSGTGVLSVINMDINPATVDFSNVVMGQSLTQTLTIINLATSTGTLDGSVGSLSEPFSVVSGGGTFSLLPGKSRSVVIRFSPTSLGTLSQTLSITHNATNLTSPKDVSLVGTGVAAVNLSIAPTPVDFGDVIVNKAATQTITITNLSTSTGVMEGSVDSLSGPFSVVSGAGSFSLGIGQSKKVVVSFTPTFPGPFSGTLSVTHNATNLSSPTSVSLIGTGVPAINLSVNPSPMDFGEVTVGQSPTQTLTITNLSTSVGTLDGEIGTLSSPFSVISGGGPFSLAVGQSKKVVVSFSPTSAGSFAQALSLTHNATNESNPLNVDITGTAVPPIIAIDVSPNPADFSGVAVGQSAVQTITITNLSISTGTLNATVDTGSLSDPFFVISGGGDFSLSPGKSKSVTVRFSPSSLGVFSDTLSITHNATSQSSPTGVSLNGTAIPAVNLSVGPSPVNFGNTPVGASVNQTLTITNLSTSTGTLEGSVGTLSGPFSVINGGGDFSLGPGKSKSIVISFSPTSGGVFSDNLTITHNATNQSSPTTVPLGGTGAAPVVNIDVSPNPANFSSVVVGAATSQTLIITNLPTSTGLLEGNIDTSSLSSPFTVATGGGSFSLEPGKSRSIIVSFSPSSVGPFSGTLFITHNATNQSSPTGVSLNGTGAPAIGISLGPVPINFGNVAVGKSAPQVLTITNPSTSSGTLEGNVVGGLSSPFTIVDGSGAFSLAPGQSKRVGISFSPTSPDTFSQSITITHNAQNQTSPLDVPVIGTGIIVINLSISATSVNFGTIPLGKSLTQTLTIANDPTSTAALTGNVGDPSGPFSVVSGGGGFNLAPGKSTSIVVGFSPSSGGIFAGSLPITHNATNQSNPLDIQLSGLTPILWGIRGDNPVPGDYDGDNQTDIAVWRPADGTWYVQNPPIFQPWGLLGDRPVPGDYDGDGKTDFAVFRPSFAAWLILGSSGGVKAQQFGRPTDIPVPGDYDGDGLTDLATFTSSVGLWTVQPSSGGDLIQSLWGQQGDVVVPGDYDGDGLTDMAVWRPADGTWYILFPTGAASVTQWGLRGDTPVPADYDGDGKTDLAVWRPSEGNWYILFSGGGFLISPWGISGDIPVSGDYNGDGKADLAVWRQSEGNWYLRFMD